MKSEVKPKYINNTNEKNIKSILCPIIKFILCFALGVFLYILLSDSLPLQLIIHITSLFNSHYISNELRIFIYEIIVNSVDIFKISFIIILSGLTYIYSIISNLCIALSGLFYGFSTTLCIYYVVKMSLTSEYVVFEISILILKIILFSAVIIYCSVMSTKIHESLNRSDNRNLLVKFRLLSNYLLSMLMLFGYVIIFEVLFRFVYKIFY